MMVLNWNGASGSLPPARLQVGMPIESSPLPQMRKDLPSLKVQFADALSSEPLASPAFVPLASLPALL